MIIPPLPENEEERLRALHALEILDTPREDRFDRLTRLAAHFFSTPMSLVTLLDKERQWFKSDYGLGIPELPRDISFCGHAILQKGVMVVPDATKDERFHDNPAVGGKHGIYFYAGHPIYSLDGFPLGTICVLDNKPREISQQLLDNLRDWARLVEQEICNAEIAQLNQQLRASEAQNRQILEQCQDAFIILSDQGVVSEWNPKASSLFGWSRRDAMGKKLVDLIVPPQEQQAFLQQMAKCRDTDRAARMEQRLELTAQRKTGETFPVEMTLGLVNMGQSSLFTTFLHDISQRKQHEDLLQQQALQDALTGLPNRAFLYNRMAQALAESRQTGKSLALLFLDLDKFKQINDTFGHAAGDQMLIQFAQRLKGQVRQSDVVARLAGDEFVILLEQVPQDSQIAVGIAEKVIGAMAQPFLINGIRLQGFTSIGIALTTATPDGAASPHERPAISPDELLKMADHAMYAAKKSGTNQIRVFG